ncbi:hypothetical protein Afil01_65830 [Actinorhabdospora filicis]|uniref:DUF4233 domain-containing protein n=1 Tax=Actinorhabdospora filicis TaxID=1785913 RepID=A0A9W6SW12_9ACTN|nr:hypothetical protein Afil01_65830 [Actinorhabdospora filicis]
MENGEDDATRSGLRDPKRAVRTLGASVLGLEAIVLLMALAPMRMLKVPHLGWAVTVVLVLTAAAIVLAGMTKRAWAWHAGTVLQLALLPCYFFHWSLTAIGVVFLGAWLYTLHVRKVLSRPPVRDTTPG